MLSLGGTLYRRHGCAGAATPCVWGYRNLSEPVIKAVRYSTALMRLLMPTWNIMIIKLYFTVFLVFSKQS